MASSGRPARAAPSVAGGERGAERHARSGRRSAEQVLPRALEVLGGLRDVAGGEVLGAEVEVQVRRAAALGELALEQLEVARATCPCAARALSR